MNTDYKTYINETHDEERAFYGAENIKLINCSFSGKADGESALKETSNIIADNCNFLLRYPFWHTTNAVITNSKMTETCRAALWYDNNIKIEETLLGGIKAVRECDTVEINNCQINSTEFCWYSKNITITNSKLTSEYPFLNSSNITLDNFKMKGKYSFQYVNNMVIKNSDLDTKDAFWHSNNVTVYDSIVKGEYLGWYSNNLRLVNCKIIGTQPLCYANNLTLENCEMLGCDLSFENSHVNANIYGEILSIKNPLSGHISADSIGEIIIDQPQSKCIITENPQPCNL